MTTNVTKQGQAEIAEMSGEGFEGIRNNSNVAWSN